MTQGMTQMHDLAPSFEDALAEVQQELHDARREWSGVMMSMFPDHRWMVHRARRLRDELGAADVEFNAICEGAQVTICNVAGQRKAILARNSLCVITASTGIPMAVDDVWQDKVTQGHPAADICRSWASYPVLVNGVPAGTVCALESPEPRAWTKDDEAVLGAAATDLSERIADWLAKTV